MKDEFYPVSSPNVLFFEFSNLEDSDEMVDSYIELLQGCKTNEEINALFYCFREDVIDRTAKLIIEKQIHSKIEILNELRKSY